MGEINKARQTVMAQKTTQPAAKPSGPIGPPQPPITMEETIASKYKNGSIIKDAFDINASIGSYEGLTNMDLNSSPEYVRQMKKSKVTPASDMFKDSKGVTGMKQATLSESEMPIGRQFENMLKNMYIKASQDGITSGAQFNAYYDDLLKTQPVQKELLDKFGGPEKGGAPIKPEVLKKVAAEQYQRLLNEQRKTNEQRASFNKQETTPTTSATTSTTTPTTSMPNTATSTKLKVTKTQ